MGLVRDYFNNTRKPEGLLGRWMVAGMNRAHAAVSDWGMGHLPARLPARIIELGCGGGRNARKLLHRFPDAEVTAVDHAPVAVERTRRLNARAVRAGRCRVVQADVAALPFEDGCFDVATAFETVYFWPGPAESFREVWRVLRPGGLFLVVNESDGAGRNDGRWAELIDGLHIYDGGRLVSFLREAGFSKVAVDHDARRHRLCLCARK